VSSSWPLARLVSASLTIGLSLPLVVRWGRRPTKEEGGGKEKSEKIK